jgi:uncharacterized protein YjbI with pentapeptide repeats
VANYKLVEFLSGFLGPETWNEWRSRRPNERIDLSGAKLGGAHLERFNLSNVNLTGAYLHEANLAGTDLSGAWLDGAELGGGVQLDGANLIGASLINTNLDLAFLTGTDLRRTNLQKANLNQAALNGADLRGANLSRASLMEANLDGADLSQALLVYTNFSRARLENVNFDSASLARTIFADTDLSRVKGLETCLHEAASLIDFTTLKRSVGLPKAFLRGIGLPDIVIEYLPSKSPSCFISYSSKDEVFAKRIYNDLQDSGVRCWFAPHDLRIGDKTLDAVDDAIRVRDKLIVILSKNSIGSQWVEDEVNTAFEEERRRRQTVLFPIRLDDAVMRTETGWASKLRANRNIGDFRKWRSRSDYERALARVLRDLEPRQKKTVRQRH